MSQATGPDGYPAKPRWQPLPAIDRRVVGVLVEKAKTTPEQYPLTLNAIRTGANQKNNRFPLMDLDPDDVEEALERLRPLGAITELHDSGRTLKYRHRMYEWLGVEKLELAVMTELLLRGAQTVGELRGRAARMDPIADLNALQPILDSLKAKGLIVYLTPEGRGAVLTHTLYERSEFERLKKEHEYVAEAEPAAASPPPPPRVQSVVEAPAPRPVAVAAAPAAPAANPTATAFAAIFAEVESLRRDLAQCQGQVTELRELLGEEVVRLQNELSHIKGELGI